MNLTDAKSTSVFFLVAAPLLMAIVGCSSQQVRPPSPTPLLRSDYLERLDSVNRLGIAVTPYPGLVKTEWGGEVVGWVHSQNTLEEFRGALWEGHLEVGAQLATYGAWRLLFEFDNGDKRWADLLSFDREHSGYLAIQGCLLHLTPTLSGLVGREFGWARLQAVLEQE